MSVRIAPALVAASLAATIAGIPRPVRVAEPLFVEAAAATGLAFTHHNGATGQYYMPELMGSGVALFDYDGDGDLDVFLVDSGPIGGSPAGSATSRLFRTDLSVGAGGRRTLRFADVTSRAGIGWRAYGMGAAAADYDNDGDLDLFLSSFGPDALYRNNGDGTFTDVTADRKRPSPASRPYAATRSRRPDARTHARSPAAVPALRSGPRGTT